MAAADGIVQFSADFWQQHTDLASVAAASLCSSVSQNDSCINPFNSCLCQRYLGWLGLLGLLGLSSLFSLTYLSDTGDLRSTLSESFLFHLTVVLRT